MIIYKRGEGSHAILELHLGRKIFMCCCTINQLAFSLGTHQFITWNDLRPQRVARDALNFSELKCKNLMGKEIEPLNAYLKI